MRNHLLESDTALGESMRKSLAEKLDAIASGSYYEPALIAAKNLTFVTKEEFIAISQYLYGNTAPEHRWNLQGLAIKLRTMHTQPVGEGVYPTSEVHN